MSETILVAIISAGLATLINSIFQIINRALDTKKDNKGKEQEKESLYKEKKEEAYIAALDRLLQIRRGFDYTSDDVMRSEQLREMIQKQTQEFIIISPKLRLYASDNIFHQYESLMSFSQFAYASPYGPRLAEESKRLYDVQITQLAHLMQEDLGYREYNNGPDTIICPECGEKHDIVKACPSCGMTFDKLKIKAQEMLKQVQESSQNSESESEETLENS